MQSKDNLGNRKASGPASRMRDMVECLCQIRTHGVGRRYSPDDFEPSGGEVK